MTTLPSPFVCLVTDRHVAGGIEALVRIVDAAIEGGINVVQVREKDLPDAEMTSLAQRLRDIIAGRALLIVNSSVAVALAVQADGVHLPEQAMDATNARREAKALLVGRSTHDIGGTIAAARAGADYVQVGSVFATESHPGEPGAGLGLIESTATAVNIPVIGVGGINAANAGSVIAAGAAGVAVIRGVLAAPDPRAAARALCEAIEVAWARRAAEALR